jgi:hypothetical protein
MVVVVVDVGSIHFLLRFDRLWSLIMSTGTNQILFNEQEEPYSFPFGESNGMNPFKPKSLPLPTPRSHKPDQK